MIWNLVTNTSKICNVAFIFQNLLKFFFYKNVTKNEKIHMESKSSINLFEIRRRIGHLIIDGRIFFSNLFIIFRHYYYAKYMSVSIVDFIPCIPFRVFTYTPSIHQSFIKFTFYLFLNCLSFYRIHIYIYIYIALRVTLRKEFTYC